MKSIGIVRKVDGLGRFVLPKEIREVMNLKPKDPVEIYVDEGSIILKKYNSGCCFCGSNGENILYNDKKVCKTCIENYRNNT